MKKVGDYLKNDKGSIKTVVLVTVIFFITILSTAYMVTATLRKSQLKSEITAKEIYERDLKNIGEITEYLNRWSKLNQNPQFNLTFCPFAYNILVENYRLKSIKVCEKQ